MDETILHGCRDEMSRAQERLSEVLGRTGQCDETVGSLYGILQKQRERESERAVGIAYAESAATGGRGAFLTVGTDTERTSDSRADLSVVPWDEIPYEGKSATEWYAAIKQLNEERKIQGKEKNI